MFYKLIHAHLLLPLRRPGTCHNYFFIEITEDVGSGCNCISDWHSGSRVTCGAHSPLKRMQPYLSTTVDNGFIIHYVLVNKVYQINIEKCNVHTCGRGIAGS